MNTSYADTFLPPIEKPSSPILKLVYSMTRRQFGKVLTPLKVFSARLPLAFGLFYGKIGKLDKQLLLPAETVFLIRQQVARINICLFCIDIARSFAIKASMNQAKFDALGTDPEEIDRQFTWSGHEQRDGFDCRRHRTG